MRKTYYCVDVSMTPGHCTGVGESAKGYWVHDNQGAYMR